MSQSTPTSTRPLLGTRVGVVTSVKRDKTATVVVEFKVQHPKYGKYIKKAQKFQVHDAKNELNEGDRVEIGSCRPMSKTKSHRLVRVVEAAPMAVDAFVSDDVASGTPAGIGGGIGAGANAEADGESGAN